MVPFKCTSQTKFQNFQFSIIHRYVTCNSRLCKIGVRENDKCDFCEDKDTIIHRFCGCPEVKVFWLRFCSWWKTLYSTNLGMTDEAILLGFWTEHRPALNNSIIIAKYFIHLFRLQKKPVNFERFKIVFRQKFEIE
jgi:hypothetical protein